MLTLFVKLSVSFRILFLPKLTNIKWTLLGREIATDISCYIPVGLRPFNVMIEQKILMVVFLRKQMDYVGLQLILDLDM